MPSLLATTLFSPEALAAVIESVSALLASEGIIPMESLQIGSGDILMFVQATTVMMSPASGMDSGRLCVSYGH